MSALIIIPPAPWPFRPTRDASAKSFGGHLASCLPKVAQTMIKAEGHTLPEAGEVEALMGPWDSNCSLRHMIQVVRRAILNATIKINSGDVEEIKRSLKILKNCMNLAT